MSITVKLITCGLHISPVDVNQLLSFFLITLIKYLKTVSLIIKLEFFFTSFSIHENINYELPSGTATYPKLIVYLPCQNSVINHFSGELWLLLLVNEIQKPRSGYQMCHRSVFRPSSWREHIHGLIYTHLYLFQCLYMQQHSLVTYNMSSC